MFAYEITYARQNVATGPVFPSIPIGDDVVTGQRDPSMMVSVPRKGDPVCAYNYCTNQANRCIPVNAQRRVTLRWRENERGNARTSRPSLNFWRFAMLVMLVCMLVCSACLSPVLIGAGTLSRWQDPQVIGHRRESCLRSFNLTRASIPVCYMGMEKKKKRKRERTSFDRFFAWPLS